MSTLGLAVARLVVVAIVHRSEWWEVLMSGDRCLYPGSFHMFPTEVCVGDLYPKEPRRHGSLCLPLASEELHRLPPTEDATLVRFSILDVVLQLQVVTFLLLAALDASSGGSTKRSSYSRAALHVASAVLFIAAVAAVLSAPTAKADHWAAGLMTCDVKVRPGAGLAIAALLVPVEAALAVSALGQQIRVEPVALSGSTSKTQEGLGDTF